MKFIMYVVHIALSSLKMYIYKILNFILKLYLYQIPNFILKLCPASCNISVITFLKGWHMGIREDGGAPPYYA